MASDNKKRLRPGAAAEPILSVIVPNYNHAPYLPECIDALASQSRPPDEIIVVDDGSTDNSLAVFDELYQRYPTLRIVALERNGGTINALNAGLHAARGRFVNFGAADDFALPGLFATMFPLLEDYPQAAFTCCGALVLDIQTGTRQRRPPVMPAFQAKFLSQDGVRRTFAQMDNWILSGTAVVRRDFLLEIGGLDASLGSFADGYALRKLAFTHGCCFAPIEGLLWRVREDGLSRSLAADPRRSRDLLDTAVGLMRGDPAFPEWYADLFERRFRFGVARLAALARPMNQAILLQLGARGLMGRLLLRAAARLGGRTGYVAALAWLVLRERPMSLTKVVRTALWRRTQPERHIPEISLKPPR